MKLEKRKLLVVSVMLFALFFGAGNLIFPPFLAKRVGFFDWKQCKIADKNMLGKARQNKKTFTKGGFAE